VSGINDDPDSPLALINKMVELGIIEEPEDSNSYLSLWQGLRSMLLNYIRTKVSENQLQEMMMMVFSLKTVQSNNGNKE
jgi:hypothetical protein